MQSLALDIKVLSADNEELEIRELDDEPGFMTHVPVPRRRPDDEAGEYGGHRFGDEEKEGEEGDLSLDFDEIEDLPGLGEIMSEGPAGLSIDDEEEEGEGEENIDLNLDDIDGLDEE
jgi:hypothetical protein